jgi:hypothetical protein
MGENSSPVSLKVFFKYGETFWKMFASDRLEYVVTYVYCVQVTGDGVAA